MNDYFYKANSLFLFSLIIAIFFANSITSNSNSNSNSNSIKEWTDAQLNLVEETGPEINRLFLFYADWCSACRRYKPKFQMIRPDILAISSVEVIQINLDNAPLLGSRFRISHLPSLFHQLDGDFRKVDTFQNNLIKYFENKAWNGISIMGPLSPPKLRQTETGSGSSSPRKLTSLLKSIESFGVSIPVFVILVSILLLLLTFFLIWCIWLYTDYKLNSHNFTDEAIKERVKFLRKQPEFKGEFADEEFEISDKDDSGDESDSESSENETNERVPLRGRRSSLKNRLK